MLYVTDTHIQSRPEQYVQNGVGYAVTGRTREAISYGGMPASWWPAGVIALDTLSLELVTCVVRTLGGALR
jgi:hypothetical protein